MELFLVKCDDGLLRFTAAGSQEAALEKTRKRFGANAEVRRYGDIVAGYVVPTCQPIPLEMFVLD